MPKTKKTASDEALEAVDAAQSKVTDLVARLTETRTAITVLESEIRDAGSRDAIHEAALALLDGGDAPVAVETRAEALKRAQREAVTLERAVQLAQGRLNDARIRAGQKIGESRIPMMGQRTKPSS